MKKTNKTFKRFAAITSASLLAACAVAPVAFNAFAAPSTIEITNTNTDAAVHNYEAYQIFAGKISGENKVLTEIEWGTGIDDSKKIELLEALAEKNTAFAKNLVTYTIAEDATDAQEAYVLWNSDGTKSYKDYYDYLKGEGLDTTGITITCDAKSAEAIADVLSTATLATDDPLAKDFAEVVGKYLSTVKEDSHVVTEDEAVDKDEANGIAGGTYAEFDKGDVIIPGLDDGYYLIQDAATSPGSTVSGDNSGAKTRFILKVTNNATLEVNAKASAPTVMKKVQEDSLATTAQITSFAGKSDYSLGNGYNDVADYAIGDDVPFKLYGTMPSTLDDYDHYYYKFTDNLGSQFNQPTSLTINIGDVKKLVFNWIQKDLGNGTYEWAYVTAGESNGNCSVTFNNGELEITFKDIKAYENTTDPENVKTVTNDTVVTVEYNAVLNETAKIGYEGQLNKVDLTYSNNPNEEYKPWNEDGTSSDDEVEDTGTTKEDGVIVFTYGFDINKYENGDFAEKLEGAKFAAYYYGADGTTKNYLVVEDGLFTGETVANPAENTNSVWTSSTSGNIEIKGLDVGTYYITEIEAPDGYNKLVDDIAVVVESSYSDADIYTQNWTYSEGANFVYNDETGAKIANQYSALDAIKLTYNSNTITVADAEQEANEDNGTPWAELMDLGTVNIENKAGTSLPGTGGIGTTIFYLGGGAMAAIGGIYLISKRRMRKSEE